jgi:dimethyl sulfoxide reductase iron-sulfur subunit
MRKLSRRQVLGLAMPLGASALLGSNLVAQTVSAADISNPRPPIDTNRRLRRWVMVIDLRYCDGCTDVGQPPLCTQSCILGRGVPAGQEWIQVYQYELHGGGTQFVPTPCMQCQNAPCKNVCPVAATFSTPEGVVLIDQERCIGCRICMAACPYQRRFFNWGEPVIPPIPPHGIFAEYSPEHQYPAKKGTVMKCDFCPEKPREGTLPMCVQGCPHGAIYFSDEEEDIATNGWDVVKLSRLLSENQAYRMKEDLGTQPSVYYIAGHGEAIGRSPFDKAKPLPAEWPWDNKI